MNEKYPKMHLSLYVKDLDKTTRFYNTFFNQNPAKRKPGYAKYILENPALVISFIEKKNRQSPSMGHLGFQVENNYELHKHLKRIQAANLPIKEENQTKCCYALQDKFWVSDPDGYPWEIYVLHEDTDVNDPEYTLDIKEPCCEPTMLANNALKLQNCC